MLWNENKRKENERKEIKSEQMKLEQTLELEKGKKSRCIQFQVYEEFHELWHEM